MFACLWPIPRKRQREDLGVWAQRHCSRVSLTPLTAQVHGEKATQTSTWPMFWVRGWDQAGLKPRLNALIRLQSKTLSFWFSVVTTLTRRLPSTKGLVPCTWSPGLAVSTRWSSAKAFVRKCVFLGGLVLRQPFCGTFTAAP